jgi:DNA adenine methylase
MKPLYIWAGGKNKMIPKYQINPGIPMQGYDTFVEPFFGGGAMMIHIYKNNPTVTRFIINDINPEIIGIYKSIKYNVTDFIQVMDSLSAQYLPLNKSDRKVWFYQKRKEYITPDTYHKWSSVEESANLYFLMKTAFNGIFQSTIEAKGRFCTPSGLLNQTTSVYDKENVLEWHTFLQKVDIFSGDWKECANKSEGKSFYFFDPPYRDSFTQYGQVFGDDKTKELIDFSKEVDSRGDLVMYCNRDAGDTFYTDNQGSLEIAYYPVTYTAGRRKKNEDGTHSAKAATEILLYSRCISTNSGVFNTFFKEIE